MSMYLKHHALVVLLCYVAPFLLPDNPQPALVELNQPPAPKVEPKVDVPPVKVESPLLDIGKHRQFRIGDGYKGPVEWVVEGDTFVKRQVNPPKAGDPLKQVFAIVELQGKGWGEYELLPDDVLIRGVKKGPSKLVALGVIDGRPKILLSKVFQVGGAVDPIVDPKVDPKVDPVVPAVAPIAPDGLYILIVFEENFTLTEDQYAVLYGADLRKAMSEKCANASAVRVWPTTAVTTGAPKIWQDAFARPRKSTPWMIATNPLKNYGYEGPLKTQAEIMEILSKYGK